MIQDLHEISDGKIYGLNDMAKLACADCAGCHACCEDMGNSIVLDPLDVFRLTKHMGKTMEELLAGELELNVSEGVILPNLKMTERAAEDKEKMPCCPFLNEEGRCSIHAFRPGLCRVFPLGRIYEEDGVHYFLQSDACRKGNGSKVKVSRWLDTPELKANQQFLADWHRLRKKLTALVQNGDESMAKQGNLFVLKLFYLKPYEEDRSFYEQFYERLRQAEGVLG
ncbi:MAG: YkgJ family cysteine cluster protein [Roseburia sp.]